MKTMRFGILGGTFDPVHNGHIRIAYEAMDRLKLDKVLFVPAYIPPHKGDKKILFSKQFRLKILQRVLKGRNQFSIETHEMKRNCTTYSIDSIAVIKKKYGAKNKYYFLVGSDWAGHMHTWKDFSKLRSEVTVCFVPRDRKQFFPEKNSQVLDIPVLEISSSMIRKMLDQKHDVTGLVSDSILSLLKKVKTSSK